MRFDFQHNPAGIRQYLFVSAATFFLVAAGSSVYADDFYLASGKVVRGAVMAETPTEYTLKTEMGTIRLPKADISRTVSAGTTPAEIEGDIAITKGDLTNAVTLYRQAAASAASDSAAATRLNEKISRLSSATRQMAAGTLTNQFTQARELMQSRNYDAAEVLLDKLAAQLSATDPMTSEVLKMQARLHHGKGKAAADAVKLDIARQEFEDAMLADPAYYPAYLDLGKSLLGNSGTTARGMTLIEQGLDIAGEQLPEQDRFANKYLLATKYFEQGNYSKAAATYAELIPARSRYPAYSDALDKAVESYVKMGEENLSSDFRETVANLNEALQLNPTNQKALFLLGRIYLDNGEIENAVIVLKKLVEVAPNYEEANHYLGRAYFKSRDYDQALAHLSTEIQSHPGNYSVLVDRAEVYIAKNDYPAAQSDLEAAKTLDPENWYAFYLTGLQHFKEQKYPDAQAAVMQALERRPKAMPSHLLMGRVLMKQNEPVAARKWFEQVGDSLEPVTSLSYRFRTYQAEAYSCLSQISVDEKSPRQALNYAERAVSVAPDYVPAMLALAEAKILSAEDPAMQKSALYAEAEALYQKAMTADPENPEVYLKAGTFYLRIKKDNEKARQNLNLYVDKGGKDSQVNSLLVEAGGTARSELNPPPTSAMTVLDSATAGTIPTTATITTTSIPMEMSPTSPTMAVPNAVPVMPAMPIAPGVQMVPMTQTVPVTTATTATQ